MSGWPSLPLGLAGALLADEEMASVFSAEAEIEAMLAFERELARAQHALGVLDAAALAAVEAVTVPDTLETSGLLAGIARDGLAVPAMVQQLRSSLSAAHEKALHQGSTSQDVIDTALMLRLKHATAILAVRLDTVVEALDGLTARAGAHPMIARTRFQDALPFTFRDRIETWRAPLEGLRASVPTVFPLQFGGAIGRRYEAYGPKADRIAVAMAEALGLNEIGRPWHTDRQPLSEIVAWPAALAIALGKIGQDVALMAQNPVAEVRAPGGGSSAMPHKNNPVGAELMVSLARYVTAHAAMVQQASLHENERSGIAWTQEWLALPPIFLGAAVSTRTAATLIPALEAGPAAP
ncbi:MAG: lyase family protein [Pseudomonadota bacterium]